MLRVELPEARRRPALGRRPHAARRRSSTGEDVMHGDLRDPAVVDRLLDGVDVLIHLAGTSVERPLPEIIENNLVGLYAGLRRRTAPQVQAHRVRQLQPRVRHVFGRRQARPRRAVSARRLLRPVARCGARRWRACTGTSTASRASRVRIGSDDGQPPENLRQLSTWFGHRRPGPADRCAASRRRTSATSPSGASRTTRAATATSAEGDAIGYAPTQNAEDYAERS